MTLGKGLPTQPHVSRNWIPRVLHKQNWCPSTSLWHRYSGPDISWLHRVCTYPQRTKTARV